MKKVLFFGVFSVFFTAFGQNQESENKLTIEKGMWLTAANISFSSNEFESPNNANNRKTLGFGFAPKIGYTLKKNFIVGLGIGYSINENNSLNSNTTSLERRTFQNQGFNFSPFLRTYKGLGENLALFLQGELGYSRGWGKSSFNDQQESTFIQNSYSLSISPGLTYFMSKKLALEATIGSLGYSKFDSKTNNLDSSATSGSQFFLSLDTSNVFFGVAYYF